MRPNEALLQHLVAITVQIRHTKHHEQIVGAGVVVSRDGKVATCAHVVRDAGVEPKTGYARRGWWQFLLGWGDRTLGEVGVYFPARPGRPSVSRRARVWKSFKESDDDVVVLELVGDPPNLTARDIAVLGRSEASFGKPFWSAGFPRLPVSRFHSAQGLIHATEPEHPGCLTGRVELHSAGLDRGMSGAPVLDSERNLVVGVISEIWDSQGKPQNRDAAWAVNARVLGLEPIGLVVSETELPLTDAPRSQIDLSNSGSAAAVRNQVAWNSGLENRPQWVGRRSQLELLSHDWHDDRVRVSVWTGVGGEGKSAFVRRWLEELATQPLVAHPEGVFWWTFGLSGSVDEFFEKAIVYVTDGKMDLETVRSTSERVHLLARLLYSHRYVFVLDQLDMVQHQAGDMLGFVSNPDLAEFLALCAAPQHDSFCIVTSRLSVLDLWHYSPQVVSTHLLGPLNTEEGRELLAQLRVLRSNTELDQIVVSAEGNALTLTLIAAALSVSSSRVRDSGSRERGGNRGTDQFGTVLRNLDQRLDAVDRALLMIVSALRVPMDRTMLGGILAGATRDDPIVGSLVSLNEAQRGERIELLVERSLFRFDGERNSYSLHSLLKAHYAEQLQAYPPSVRQALHSRIHAHYLAVTPAEIPESATLQDIAAAIEAVHHGVLAGKVVEAFDQYAKLALPPRSLLFHGLGAIDTDLALVKEFFPNGDLDAEPFVTDLKHKSWLINEAGVSMAALGNIRQAITYLEKSVELARRHGEWLEAGTSATNLATMHALTGSLRLASARAIRAYRDGRRINDIIVCRQSLAVRGWIAGLRGLVAEGLKCFEQADLLGRQLDPAGVPLEGVIGIRQAELLCWAGKVQEGCSLARQFLDFAAQARRLPLMSVAHRVLGVWDSRLTDPERRRHLDEAVRLARMVRRQEALIEALIARGRRNAPSRASGALDDLEEALSASLAGGFRILQAQVHLGLAELDMARGNSDAAAKQRKEAKRLSEETGYDLREPG